MATASSYRLMFRSASDLRYTVGLAPPFSSLYKHWSLALFRSYIYLPCYLLLLTAYAKGINGNTSIDMLILCTYTIRWLNPAIRRVLPYGDKSHQNVCKIIHLRAPHASNINKTRLKYIPRSQRYLYTKLCGTDTLIWCGTEVHSRYLNI